MTPQLESLVKAIKDTIKWLQDDRWGTWTYMESSQVYDDKDQATIDLTYSLDSYLKSLAAISTGPTVTETIS